MNKHTPGQWQSDSKYFKVSAYTSGPHAGDFAVKVGLQAIAFSKTSPEEAFANAHLIAACPDLLELLQHVLIRLDLEAGEHPDRPFPCAAMRNDIRVAIAKATGQEA